RQYAQRRVLASEMIVDYARMASNAAYEAGPDQPRSSFERIALAREALGSCRQGLALATTPRQRSEAATLVGFVHEVWGFPYDAYLTYRAAANTDPSFGEARSHLDDFMRRLSPRAPR